MEFELLITMHHEILLTGVMESCGCGGFCAGFGGGGGGGSRVGSAAFESALLPSPPPASIVLLSSSSSTSIGSPGPETSAILSETKRELEGEMRGRDANWQIVHSTASQEERQDCGAVQPGPMDAADFKNGPRLARPMPARARRCRAEIRDDLYKNNPKT